MATTHRAALLPLLLLVPLLAACPDTAGRLDRFEKKSDPLRTKPAELVCDGPVDASGPYFIAVAVAIQPELPILFGGDLEVDLDAMEVSLTMHVLETQTRALIGDALFATGALEEDGRFTLDFGDILVPAAGDAILHVDVRAELVFRGCTRAADLACGFVEGTVTQPTTVPLAGSTWAGASTATTAVTDAPVLVSCEAAETL